MWENERNWRKFLVFSTSQTLGNRCWVSNSKPFLSKFKYVLTATQKITFIEILLVWLFICLCLCFPHISGAISREGFIYLTCVVHFVEILINSKYCVPICGYKLLIYSPLVYICPS